MGTIIMGITTVMVMGTGTITDMTMGTIIITMVRINREGETSL